MTTISRRIRDAKWRLIFLGLERKPIMVKSYYDHTTEARPGLFKITVQPLDVWVERRPPTTPPPWPHTNRTKDVLVVDEPIKMDIIHLCGADPSIRSDILRCDAMKTDCNGCLAELLNPQVVKPTLPLSSKSIPVLCLMDALKALNFDGMPLAQDQNPRSVLVYDTRQLSSKRIFLQCLLSHQDLNMSW